MKNTKIKNNRQQIKDIKSKAKHTKMENTKTNTNCLNKGNGDQPAKDKSSIWPPIETSQYTFLLAAYMEDIRDEKIFINKSFSFKPLLTC